MPRGFTSIIILLGIALIILIGGVVIYQKVLAPKTQPTPTPTISIIPSSISQPSPTPDPTAGWKTFLPLDYAFSIKYPAAWGANPTFEGMEAPLVWVKDTTSPIFNSRMHFYQFKKEISQSLSSFSQQHNEAMSKSDCYGECPQVTLAKEINKENIIIVRYNYSKFGSMERIVYYAAKESDLEVVAMLTADKGNGGKEFPSEIFDKIANTLSFIK